MMKVYIPRNIQQLPGVKSHMRDDDGIDNVTSTACRRKAINRRSRVSFFDENVIKFVCFDN